MINLKFYIFKSEFLHLRSLKPRHFGNAEVCVTNNFPNLKITSHTAENIIFLDFINKKCKEI